MQSGDLRNLRVNSSCACSKLGVFDANVIKIQDIDLIAVFDSLRLRKVFHLLPVLPTTIDILSDSKLTRRSVLGGLLLMTAGCASPNIDNPGAPPMGFSPLRPDAEYGALPDEKYPIEALDVGTMDPALFRQEVDYPTKYRPGTIVVNIPERRLYLIQPDGKAIRYAVGVGRTEALNFSGTAVIGRKAEWPNWTPTASMIERIPRYSAYAGGMPGGIENPLGPRALYLYRDGTDTHFRLHGTIEPETIGTAVSSGCIRLFNHDIIDLYNRVPVGATVIVQQS